MTISRRTLPKVEWNAILLEMEAIKKGKERLDLF
jgi:hypothetical protein